VQKMGPKHGNQDEKIGHNEGARIDHFEIQMQSVEYERLASRVYPRPKEGTDAKDKELDLPAMSACRGSKGLLKQHHDENNTDQETDMKSISGPTETEQPPMRRIENRNAAEEI